MSDWGQGARNNNVGWGQGASNNNIGWGASHQLSWSGDTDIFGSLIPALISVFEARVLADGGVFEAEACLSNILSELL